MTYKGRYDKVAKTLNITPWSLLFFVLLCTVSYGRGRMVPPEPGAPEDYEVQLQEAETVEDVRKFLVDIGDLQSLDRPSAQLLAFEKLATLPDKEAAIDILSRMFHEGAYVHSRSLSRHVKGELIRTFGKIGTTKAKAEVFRILDQALQLEKVADSPETSQLGIIKVAMETLVERWYQTPEVRDYLRQIAKQFDEHSETVRTHGCKYYLMSDMRAQGIEETREKVEWLLEAIDYDAYKRIEEEQYTYFKGDKGTWPGLRNEAIKEALKSLSPEVTDYLEEKKTKVLAKKRHNIIEFLVKRTSRMRSVPALNFLHGIIRGTDSHGTEWWGSKIGIPKEKIFDKEYIEIAIGMLNEGALRFVDSDFREIEPPDDKRHELQELILEKSKARLQEIEKSEEAVPSPPEITVSEEEVAEVLPEKEIEEIRRVRFLWPITIIMLAGGLIVALAYYFFRRRGSKP